LPCSRQSTNCRLRRRWRLLLALAGLGLVFNACSSTPKSKQEWLRVFFDGVPDPDAPAAAVLSEGAARGSVAVPTQGVPPSAAVPVVAHAPYQKRQCQSCHETTRLVQLRLPATELCDSCHQGIVGARALAHAPAVSGDCLACHRPHSTETPHLLVTTGPGLCLQCHDAGLLTPQPAHREEGGDSCFACHDPHEGDRAFFLREPRAAEAPSP
jgi:predicted CXXCH cytochrome family protein